MFNRRGAQADNRPICKFFKEGRCRYGDQCKFRHDNSNNNGNNNGNSNNNNNNNHHDNKHNTTNRNVKNNAYNLDRDAIRADLTYQDDKPGWPLSAYGPGRDAPLQLISQPHEQSMEELRVEYYRARASGNVEQYQRNEAAASAQAEEAAREILRDIDGAIRFVINGKDKPESRLNQVTKNPGSVPSSQSGGFGQPSVQQPAGFATSGFTSHGGQNPAFPSNMSAQGNFTPQPSTINGRPAFGQPSQIGTSLQPSQSAGAKFGQASEFGANAQPPPTPMSTTQSAFPQSSGFGQPSQMGQQSAFGQPSQPAQQGAFGQPSQPAQHSAFGQPSQQSAFGQPSQQSAFGQPSQQQQSTFGQPAQQSAFGQPSQPSQPSAFGQPSASGQPSQPARSSPFAQAAAAPPQQSAFGQPSNPGQTASPFAQASANPPQQSGFGQPAQQPAQQPNGSNAPQRANFLQGKQVNRDSDGNAVYTNAQGQQERVWFPTGPPPPNPYAEREKEVYESEPLATALREAYEHVFMHGTFKDGVVPEIAPKREWVNFEL